MKTTRRKLLSLILALCMVCAVPAAASAAVTDNCIPVYIETVRYDSAAQEVLELVNEAREEAGLQPLVLDSDLQEAAMTRAIESVVSFSHTRPNGSSCLTAEPVSMVGENLAVNFGSPETVVNAWLASKEGHRENILHPEYNSIGIGCVKYNGVWFWAQAFARTEGDNQVPSGTSDAVQKVDLMTGLVELTWAGETQIALNAEEEAVETADIRAVNPGWKYMNVPLDNGLFILKSSDERVLKVTEDGQLIPVSKGTVTVTASLRANRVRSISQEITVANLIQEEDVKLSRTSYTYDGTAKTPSVTVEGLTEDEFTVTYSNNVKVGTATVTVTGTGQLAGTVTKTFKINYDKPDRVSLKTPTTGKSHYVKVRWYDEDCDGYQIRYAANSSFKNSKSVFVKDGDDVSRTIKNLTKGKRYYVKVRAYNLYEDTKVYGKWSKWKSVVCK